MLIKKLNLIFLLALVTALNALAQKTDDPGYLKFSNCRNSPSKFMFPATVTDGKYLYAINGLGGSIKGNFITKVYRYNPQPDTWTIVAKDSKAKAMAAAAYIPETNTAYVFGGMMDTFFEDNKIFQLVESVDLGSGKTNLFNVINPVTSIGTWCAAWNDKIYVFGGTTSDSTSTADMYEFDPKVPGFKPLAKMPYGAETTGAVVNGVLYTFGGFDRYAGTVMKDINAYDIKTDTWSVVGYLPEGLSSNSIAVYHGLIFIIGNTGNETFLGYFDTFNKKFTSLKSNMLPRRGGGAAVIGNKLYLYGGKSGYVMDVNGGLQTVQVADLSQFAGLNPSM